MSRQRSASRSVKDQPHKIKPLSELTMVNPHAAGLDIGARETWVCVPASSDPEPVRAFGPFTPDLHALADWLIAVLVSSTLLLGMEIAKIVLRRVRPDPYVALAKRRAVMHGRAATTPT